MPVASRHKPNVDFVFMFVSSSLPAWEQFPTSFFRQHHRCFWSFWWCHSFLLLSQLFSALAPNLKVNMESTFSLHREVFILQIHFLHLIKAQDSPCSVGKMGWDANAFPWIYMIASKTKDFTLSVPSQPVCPIGSSVCTHWLSVSLSWKFVISMSIPRTLMSHHMVHWDCSLLLCLGPKLPYGHNLYLKHCYVLISLSWNVCALALADFSSHFILFYLKLCLNQTSCKYWFNDYL